MDASQLKKLKGKDQKRRPYMKPTHASAADRQSVATTPSEFIDGSMAVVANASIIPRSPLDVRESQ